MEQTDGPADRTSPSGIDLAAVQSHEKAAAQQEAAPGADGAAPWNDGASPQNGGASSGTGGVHPDFADYESFSPGQEWDGRQIRPADDDLDLLAERHRVTNRTTVVLIAAVLAGIAFIGGVVVQKHAGGSSTGIRAGAAAGARAGGFSGGFAGAEGGFGGGAGFGRGAGTQGGTGAQGGAEAGAGGAQGATGTETTTATPVVVGTVAKVSGTTLTVKNFAGKSVTVKVPKGTTITDSSDSALTGIAKGVSVSVAGKTAADGTVTASEITAR